MSRARPPRWSIRFELSPENPDHVRLHDHLLSLAQGDSASTWIRQMLINGLSTVDKPSEPQRTVDEVVKRQTGGERLAVSIPRHGGKTFAVKNADITSPVPEVRIDQSKLPTPPKLGAATPTGLSPKEILARAAKNPKKGDE